MTLEGQAETLGETVKVFRIEGTTPAARRRRRAVALEERASLPRAA